jgi:hypothetical protein
MLLDKTSILMNLENGLIPTVNSSKITIYRILSNMKVFQSILELFLSYEHSKFFIRIILNEPCLDL